MADTLDSLDLMDLVDQLDMVRELSAHFRRYLEHEECREQIPREYVDEWLDVLNSFI